MTGRRAPKHAAFYGIQEMADLLTAEGKQFFEMRSGRYAIAVNKENEPTHFLRVDKDPRPPKIRKRIRRAMKVKALLESAQIVQ